MATGPMYYRPFIMLPTCRNIWDDLRARRAPSARSKKKVGASLTQRSCMS